MITELQCVAVCCSVLQCVASWREVDDMHALMVLQCVATHSNTLQHTATPLAWHEMYDTNQMIDRPLCTLNAALSSTCSPRSDQ